jgi:hypothetical protein
MVLCASFLAVKELGSETVPTNRRQSTSSVDTRDQKSLQDYLDQNVLNIYVEILVDGVNRRNYVWSSIDRFLAHQQRTSQKERISSLENPFYSYSGDVFERSIDAGN